MNTRNANRSLEHREGRRFGRDITNLPKLEPSKKTTLPSLSQTTQHIAVHRDPITDHQQDIMSFLHSADARERQPMIEEGSQVTEKMRQILVDWLVDVHQSFELREETLHLALQYLQDYQTRKPIQRDAYQLVGITCLWIASKYEEIYPPRMKAFVEVTAYTYTAHQLKHTEGDILRTINFDLTRVTPLALLLAHQHPHPRTNALAKYLLELAQQQGHILLRYGNRTAVAAAVRLAEAVCASGKNSGLEEGVNVAQLQTCHKELCLLMQMENKYKLTALKRKFAKETYLGVGKLRLEL